MKENGGLAGLSEKKKLAQKNIIFVHDPETNTLGSYWAFHPLFTVLKCNFILVKRYSMPMILWTLLLFLEIL